MKILYFEELDSTNKFAKEQIKNLNDKTLVYTNFQTAGRGRLERKWESFSGRNLYASIILKPSNKILEVYSNLTQYLCIILAEVFEEYGVEAQIKWPNDLRVNKKKISGILAESIVNSNGNLEGLVLGFGVNLNCSLDAMSKINQPATALNIETGMEIDRDLFIKKVIDKFCLRYNKFIEEGFLLIREDYLRRAEFLNEHINVRVFDKEVSGIANDITEQGALKIIDINNKEHVLLIGDIL